MMCCHYDHSSLHCDITLCLAVEMDLHLGRVIDWSLSTECLFIGKVVKKERENESYMNNFQVVLALKTAF